MSNIGGVVKQYKFPLLESVGKKSSLKLNECSLPSGMEV